MILQARMAFLFATHVSDDAGRSFSLVGTFAPAASRFETSFIDEKTTALTTTEKTGAGADLPHRWDHAQLLQETQQVGATPMLHDLALTHMIHVQGRNRDG